jgi:hypothetical protein
MLVRMGENSNIQCRCDFQNTVATLEDSLAIFFSLNQTNILTIVSGFYPFDLNYQVYTQSFILI